MRVSARKLRLFAAAVAVAAGLALSLPWGRPLWAADVTSLLRSLSLGKDRYFLINDEVVAALEDLSGLIDHDVAMWVASMYDPESGGFYYARSAIGRPGFGADIESTSQALRFIQYMGAWDSMPAPVHDKLVHFFQSRQDRATGYFYDPQFGSNVTNSKRSRNLNQAVEALRKLGAAPLYPLPWERQGGAGQAALPEGRGAAESASAGQKGDGASFLASGLRSPAVGRLASAPSPPSPGNRLQPAAIASESGAPSHLPQHLTSPAAFRRWLESLDWESNPYSAANNVAAARTEILNLGLADILYEFIEAIQNPETGLWGRGRTYEEVSAAMKLSSYYTTRPYPHARKMVESTIYAVENYSPTSIVFVRNPVDLINTAVLSGQVGYDPEIEALLQEHLPQIIRKAKENLLRFKQADHGFSYRLTGSAPRSQGATVSLGLPEGDMNALMAGVHATIVNLYQIVGLPVPTLPRDADVQRFWDTIVAMEPHKPVEEAIGLNEDFDADSGTPSRWQASAGSDVGTYVIVEDPADPENRVLKIEKTSTSEGLRISTSFPRKTGAAKTSVQFRFMFSEFSGSGGFNFHFGANSSASNRALSFMIGQRGGEYFLAHRRTSTGYGTYISPVAPNRWHHLRIEYEPAERNDTKVTVYLDGERVSVLSEYFDGGDESKPPVRDIGYVEFYTFVNVAATLYVDDITVTAE